MQGRRNGNGAALAGPPKQNMIIYNPVSGEEQEMVAVSVTERKLIFSIPNGATEIRLTDPAAATTLFSNFQDRDQPFPEKDLNKVIKTDLIPLRWMTDRESAVFSVAEIAASVGNTRFDNRTVMDIAHSRARPMVAQDLGVAAVPAAINQMGDNEVQDVAGSVPFVLAGGEEYIARLIDNTGDGFVADELDPFDPTQQRTGIPVMFRITAIKLGTPTSADANAGRSDAIPTGRPLSIPAAMAAQVPMRR